MPDIHPGDHHIPGHHGGSGFSEKARKSAAVARKIRTRFGEEAYLRYKEHGIIPAGLDSATPIPKPPTVTQPPLQADFRTDTPPTHSPLTVTDEFLHSLKPGDIVRDQSGQRIRVQKAIPGGLRIHDQRDGARDLSWDRLRAMGLQAEQQAPDGSGPAARRLGELRREAESLGIAVPSGASVKDIEILLGEHLAKSRENTLAQIDPMLASDDPKKHQDFSADQPWRSPSLYAHYWNNDNMVAEEKLDGVRLKLHFTPDGVRADSRRRDTKTRMFSEKSQNFGHLLAMKVPDLNGTVLDTEGMIPGHKTGILPSGEKFFGALPLSTAATNASPAVSRQIQDKFGPMQFWAFDILRYKGKDVSQLPFTERRKLLEQVHQEIIKALPPSEGFLHTTRMETQSDKKLQLFEDLISKGGEGIIFKTKNHKYQEGKRPKDWQKLKRFQEVDAYVSGFVPGKAGNEGLVGALELAVNINGVEHGIAAVSQLTLEQRKAMTAPDGSLKPEYYGQVVTFRGQELTKNGRFRHAVFVGFREDKTKQQIDGYEVADQLHEIMPEKFKPKPQAQETFL